jgi:HlyD family secretion protein
MDKRRRRKLVGRLITFTALGSVAIFIAWGFLPEPVEVTLGKVERRALEVTVEESGKTRIRDKYIVSAPVTGQLSRIELEAGDAVAEDMSVARIAPLVPQLLDARTRAEAAARVEVAEANLARTRSAIARAGTSLSFASDQAERSRTLRREGGMSEQQAELAEYQLRAAEQELASARLAERVSANELAAARAALKSVSGEHRGSIAQLEVLAPAAGQVLRVVQQSAGTVQAGAPLIEIGDPRRLEVVADILTTEAVGVAVGAVARIEHWGGGYPLEARVRSKEPSAFTTRSALGVEEQRVPVVLDIIEDPARWTVLGDGYRVEVQIRVARVDDTLAMPASALFREAGTWAAFAVKQQRARKVHVELGLRNADWAQVKRGLSLGERVVLYPSDQVAEGVQVTER